MTSPRSAFGDGVRAFLPLVLGVVPFALVSGVAAISAGLTVAQALGMAAIVYAGSAQLVAAQLIDANAPALLILVTTMIVNLRFMMYSASLAPSFRSLSQGWKWLCAYLVTDQAYAIAISRIQNQPDAPYRPWYYLGAGVMMWLTWQVGSLVGIFVGAQVPASWQLDFMVPLTFIALVVPAIKHRRLGAVAAVAAAVAALTAMMPYKLGLMISVFAAVAVGVALEARAQ